jgi:hypothetical protein
MKKIVKTERCGDGVNVVWKKSGKETTSYFSFTQLIDMQVNALDLLENPGEWGMDEKTGKIVLTV